MFVKYYGLKGRPFQLTPDPRFYFESATHRKAMSYLGYGLAQGEGFIVITGDIGAGKTTLVGHLMATIDPQRLVAVKISASEMDGDTVLRLAAHAFGIGTEGVEKAHVLSRLEAFMHQQARTGRRSLLIVDEAQTLSYDALEALRILSNFQLGGQSLIQIFLLGQPEFRDRVADASELEQLRQRIIATHHLEPLQPHEVQPYVEHRLRIVGWIGNPAFEADAMAKLAENSRGVPRLLNTLVQNALQRAADREQSTIDIEIVEAVCSERQGNSKALIAGEGAQDKVLALKAIDEEREAIRAEVHSLKESLVETVEQPCSETRQAAVADMPERFRRMEARLARIESRLVEQDELLSTILAKMIEWIEQDEAASSMEDRAA